VTFSTSVGKRGQLPHIGLDMHGHKERHSHDRVHSGSFCVHFDVDDTQQGHGHIAHDDVLDYVAVSVQSGYIDGCSLDVRPCVHPRHNRAPFPVRERKIAAGLVGKRVCHPRSP